MSMTLEFSFSRSSLGAARQIAGKKIASNYSLEGRVFRVSSHISRAEKPAVEFLISGRVGGENDFRPSSHNKTPKARKEAEIHNEK